MATVEAWILVFLFGTLGIGNAMGAHCFCKVTANGVEKKSASFNGYVQGAPGVENRCRDKCLTWWRNSVPNSELDSFAKQVASSGVFDCVRLRMESSVGTTRYKERINTLWRVGNPCPWGGSFDSANCLIGQAPPGTQPFVFENRFYYTYATTGPKCPLGSDDTANCLYQDNPPDPLAFISNGKYYNAATCTAGGWSDWQDFTPASTNTFDPRVRLRTRGSNVQIDWQKLTPFATPVPVKLCFYPTMIAVNKDPQACKAGQVRDLGKTAQQSVVLWDVLKPFIPIAQNRFYQFEFEGNKERAVKFNVSR